MKRLGNLALGVVTSIGGFVEAGSISTAVQAGAEFRFALLWAIALATCILAMLSEMAGRVALIGHRTMAAAVRERFGISFQVIPLVAELAIDALLLAAELGGVGISVKMLTGVGFAWWLLPIGVLIWALLWVATFGIVEDGLGLLGMVTLSFVVAAWWLHPPVAPILHGLVPTRPHHDGTRYAFLAVSIVGATVSPYLLNFYSSGAVEEKWTRRDIWLNRLTAYVGMGFGGVVSMASLVVAAVVFGPQHLRVDTFEQASRMFVPTFGRYGVLLFAASLGIGCFGAAVEIAVNAGYLLAQVGGWTWGLGKRRRDVSRFVTAISFTLAVGACVAAVGLNPLQLTLVSVALTVVITPLVVLPFLVLTNDREYVGDFTNGPLANGLLAALTMAGAVMAVVVIPLEIFGG